MTERRELRPRVGISSCLLGDRVRYDGREKSHAFLVEKLGPHVEWVRVCPEMELGLGVPRAKIHLVGEVESVRLLQGERDLTSEMSAWTEDRIRALRGMGLQGYFTKTRSPSCGLTDVEILREGTACRDGVGRFAGRLRSTWSSLPICEESELADPIRRESMVAAIFLLHRWIHRGVGLEALRRFHARHRLFWIWRGADEVDLWKQRMESDVAFLRELEDCYESWMIDRLSRPSGERGVLAVAEFTGCRVSPRKGVASMLDELRRILYETRPDLRPDRFFDPYPPELGFDFSHDDKYKSL